MVDTKLSYRTEALDDWIEKLGEELERHPLSINAKVMLMVLISEKVGNAPSKVSTDRLEEKKP